MFKYLESFGLSLIYSFSTDLYSLKLTILVTVGLPKTYAHISK